MILRTKFDINVITSKRIPACAFYWPEKESDGVTAKVFLDSSRWKLFHFWPRYCGLWCRVMESQILARYPFFWHWGQGFKNWSKFIPRGDYERPCLDQLHSHILSVNKIASTLRCVRSADENMPLAQWSKSIIRGWQKPILIFSLFEFFEGFYTFWEQKKSSFEVLTFSFLSMSTLEILILALLTGIGRFM